MEYKIADGIVQAVEVTLDQGESMCTQSGGMAWMSEGLELQSNVKGGLAKGIGRMFSGESLFLATYTAKQQGATIAFGATVPGVIMPVDISQGGLICQKGAFLCAESTVDLKVTFTKKISAGLFGGEGLILQELSGRGMAFLEVDGGLVVKELGPQEVLKVDTGNVFAFEKSVKYEIETVKGIKNVLFGGEGLFLTKLTGPGKVYIQTMNMAEFSGEVAKRLPAK